MTNSGRKTVYVPQIHGVYPISDVAKKTFYGTVFDGFKLSMAIGDDESETIIRSIVKHLPKDIQQYVDDRGEWVTINHFHGLQEDFEKEADAYVNYFIPIVYESGGRRHTPRRNPFRCGRFYLFLPTDRIS